jgi:hypothetical protein
MSGCFSGDYDPHSFLIFGSGNFSSSDQGIDLDDDVHWLVMPRFAYPGRTSDGQLSVSTKWVAAGHPLASPIATASDLSMSIDSP